MTKRIAEKAKNLVVAKVSETPNSIDFVVGYLVSYNKLKGRLDCYCEGHSAYNIGTCAYKHACAKNGEGIPEEIKEAAENEEDELR